MSRSSVPCPSWGLAGLLAVWAVAVATGMVLLWVESGRAGPASPLVPRNRPGSARLTLAVHPRCPCTRATLSELEHILVETPDAASIDVLAFVPTGAAIDWAEGGLLRRFASLPNATVRPDQGGRLARAEGLSTSGEITYRDASGNARFHGGVTLSRGEKGRGPSSDALRAALAGKPVARVRWPVFGCALEPAREGAGLTQPTEPIR